MTSPTPTLTDEQRQAARAAFERDAHTRYPGLLLTREGEGYLNPCWDGDWKMWLRAWTAANEAAPAAAPACAQMRGLDAYLRAQAARLPDGEDKHILLRWAREVLDVRLACSPSPSVTAAVPEGWKDKLHAAIMNLPVVSPDSGRMFRSGYGTGHRDARHAAAELVSADRATPGAPARQAVRMLTEDELTAAWGGQTLSFAPRKLESVQRKFCEVNGLEVNDAND